eukprot:gene9542-1772_t
MDCDVLDYYGRPVHSIPEQYMEYLQGDDSLIPASLTESNLLLASKMQTEEIIQ